MSLPRRSSPKPHGQARYLVFHSALVLLAGLLVGVPYGRAVHRNAPDQIIRAWRLAHGTLTLGPTLGLAIAAVLSSLSVGAGPPSNASYRHS